MSESIQQIRMSKGIGIQQFADLMGVSRLEALSIEADEQHGIIDGPTRYKAFELLNDPTLEPKYEEDQQLAASGAL